MDLVIFTMRSDKSNKYYFRRIIDFDNQSIFIASNIEYDSVAAQKTCGLIFILYIRRARPLSILSFMPPSF